MLDMLYFQGLWNLRLKFLGKLKYMMDFVIFIMCSNSLIFFKVHLFKIIIFMTKTKWRC
jgi:hypothetical protein